MQCIYCEKHLSVIKARISYRFKFYRCSICILLCYTCFIELYILDKEPQCHVIKRTWRVVFLILLQIELLNYCTSRWIIFQVNIVSVCERAFQVINYFYLSSFLSFVLNFTRLRAKNFLFSRSKQGISHFHNKQKINYFWEKV